MKTQLKKKEIPSSKNNAERRTKIDSIKKKAKVPKKKTRVWDPAALYF